MPAAGYIRPAFRRCRVPQGLKPISTPDAARRAKALRFHDNVSRPVQILTEGLIPMRE